MLFSNKELVNINTHINKKRFLNIIFICIIFLLLLAGLLKAYFFCKETNYYENRSAYQFPSISLSNFFSGDYQDNLELALSDQIPFAQSIKKIYNLSTNCLNKTIINTFFKNIYKDKYFCLGKYINIFEDGKYLIYGPRYLVYEKEGMDLRIENINTLIEKYPNLSFSIYYIEKDTDIYFESNSKSGFSDYLINNIEKKDNLKFSTFEINSYSEYKNYFYKTDHHWNYQGSYKGYCDILDMFSIDNPLPIIETVKLQSKMSGSKAGICGYGILYSEDFSAYKFNLPEHDTYINGEESSYGSEEILINNSSEKYISYGTFYGWDNGEVIFDYHNDSKGNLLIMGDSFDNAIIEMLASHFNQTYTIDLRAYEMDIGNKFNFNQYVNEHNITNVLLIGNLDFYVSDTFNLEV